MISVGPLLHHSQSPKTSYYIHSLRKILLNSSSFLSPSLVFLCFTLCRTIHSRTNQYYNSFLPAVIRDWNDLPCSDRIVDTVDDFKRQLSQGRVIVPKHFYAGNRSMQILHTRLRTGCSSLN